MPRHNPDQAARWIGEAARLARSLPPSWQGARDRVALCEPEGRTQLGYLLPGHGVVLTHNLADYGISRGSIPHVIERSLFERARDTCRGHEGKAIALAMALVMAKAGGEAASLLQGLPLLAGTIVDYDGIINARANGKAFDVFGAKASLTTVASVWSSLHRASGLPTAMTFSNIPGGSVMGSANAGALSLGLVTPGGSDKKYLLSFGLASTSALNWGLLVDVLVMAGNINANVNTSQTVSTSALTRYTTGAGVLMTLEVTTALGASASNVTVTYTNQAGTGSRSTGAIAMTASAIVGRLQPQALVAPCIPFAAGDYGVRSIDSIIFSAAMGAGVLAASLYKPVMAVPGISANAFIEQDSTVKIDGIFEMVEGSSSEIGCLGLLVNPNGASSGVASFMVRTCDG